MGDFKIVLQPGQNSTRVDLPMTQVSVTFGPGNHSLLFKEANCTVELEVIKGTELAMTLMAYHIEL